MYKYIDGLCREEDIKFLLLEKDCFTDESALNMLAKF
jgi:hypothetical protein